MQKEKTVLYASAELGIPDLGMAASANVRGGLGDLAGHTLEGLVKRRIHVIPITYLYPYDWQTGKAIDYNKTAARYLFHLDVDIYWQTRSVPIYTIDRGGARVYGINDPEAGVLYPGTFEKMRQAAFLGRASHALLKRLEIMPDIAWMNEWMTVPIMQNLKSDPAFSNVKYLFSLHTLMDGALCTMPHDWYSHLALHNKYHEVYSRDGVLDPTLAGIRMANLVNGVSEECASEARRKFPEYAPKIVAVRNGTSRDLLLSPRIKALSNVNPYSLWVGHKKDKAELFGKLAKKTREIFGEAIELDPKQPTIALFRREDGYKNRRPMFEPNIKAICAPRGATLPDGRQGLGANVIFGGVSHEHDPIGRETMATYLRWAKDPDLKGRFVYLPFYNADWRSLTVRGCDIHVECPLPRCEACGTSWMVAMLNGILNIATLGGGHKGFSITADPLTGTGDTLFIDPYTPDTLYLQVRKATDWYYDWTKNYNDWWVRLKLNNYLRGPEVDIEPMIKTYDELGFEPLLAGKYN